MARMLNASLTTDVEVLHKIIAAKDEEIRRLTELLAHATQARFGRKSEGFSPDQLALFTTDDAEIIIEDKVVTEPATTTPKKKRHVRQAVVVSKDTEIKRVEIDLDDAEKVCDCCQGILHKIGEDESLQVEYIPHKTQVVATVRPK